MPRGLPAVLLVVSILGCDTVVTTSIESTDPTPHGATAPPADAPFCGGVPATIYVSAAGRVVGGPLDGQLYSGRLDGGAAADIIVGTLGKDSIWGHGGADRICALSGDDNVDAGSGDDVVLGGPGNDVLAGSGGNDTLLGEHGDDKVIGGTLFDNCEGEIRASCEWNQDVVLLSCGSTPTYTWDMVPGTNVSVASFPTAPPGRVTFSSSAPLPLNGRADLSIYYAQPDAGWLTLDQWSVPTSSSGAGEGALTTGSSPYAPADARGRRLEAFVSASMPGAATIVPCAVRLNVLDPRLISDQGYEFTLIAAAGAETTLVRRVPLRQVGTWSVLKLDYTATVDYLTGGDAWLQVAAKGFAGLNGNGEGTLELSATPAGLAPGRHEALVTLASALYPDVQTVEVKVNLDVPVP